MFDLSVFAHSDAWVALLTLTALEIVLGIDNIVFISILTDRLPPEQQPRARSLGLTLALGSRLALLFAIKWVMGLTDSFTIFGYSLSGRDLILGCGGLFLIAKSTHEIFAKLEIDSGAEEDRRAPAGMAMILVQIALLDIVFSLDSVITAVGMADHIIIMMIAVMLAIVVMLIFANAIAHFINRHPSMKILALSFLLLIGVMLCAEALGQHIDKGYIYFAMAFSLLVELINMRVRKKNRRPVELGGSKGFP